MFKIKSNKFYKGFLYDSIKEDIEELFTDKYIDDKSTDIIDCIFSILEDKWDDVLDEEEYEDYDEKKLWDLFAKNLERDIDEDNLIESVTPDESYHGLSARERNPFLR